MGGFYDKLIFEQIPEKSEGKGHMGMRKSFLGREKNYQGPETTAFLACFRHWKEASVIRAERVRQKW